MWVSNFQKHQALFKIRPKKIVKRLEVLQFHGNRKPSALPSFAIPAKAQRSGRNFQDQNTSPQLRLLTGIMTNRLHQIASDQATPSYAKLNAGLTL